MSSSSAPPPEVTTEPTASDQEIARLRERVKELEARLAPPEPRTATNDQPQFSSIVLFGADGNLATKKTFPTLFALWRKKLLPRDIVIVGYAREAMDTETFRKNIVRSRRPAVPSRRRRDSCPSDEVVGGLFFEFEAILDRNAPRRSRSRRTPSGTRSRRSAPRGCAWVTSAVLVSRRASRRNSCGIAKTSREVWSSGSGGPRAARTARRNN